MTFAMWNEPLSKSSPLPLWFQIAERLRGAVAEGLFPPGSVLPSEAQLNEVFGVSRATSRAALDKLEQEGLVSRRSGKGSTVLSPRVDQPANQMLGFSDDMRRRGLRPSYEALSVGRVRATPEVAEALDIEVNALVFRSRRLLKADDVPMGIAVSWLPPGVLRKGSPPTASELTEGSLYDWLGRNRGVRLTGAKEYIEAAVATADLARELQIPKGAPLLVFRRRSHAEDGSPVEFAVLYFRADRYRLQLEAGVVV
jgi:GntR family transcriptional regulator